ncbi:hypothetical protein cyc_00029 [Cyclospora cayetanensis]|uniref:Uncharacterized protein n=1 Tax=Cyclospora cayetanensis TaxID=88456 RepID=A0A1D3CSH1_9EIME|nr:hypothetical protein cyc_00029 [Cyclospora cayetanensis]
MRNGTLQGGRRLDGMPLQQAEEEVDFSTARSGGPRRPPPREETEVSFSSIRSGMEPQAQRVIEPGGANALRLQCGGGGGWLWRVDAAAMGAFVSRAEALLQSGTSPSAAVVEECLRILPEADRGSLAAPLCCVALVLRAGFKAKDSEELRNKAQPLAVLTKKLIEEASGVIEGPTRAPVLLLRQISRLTNDLQCPRLSANATLIEAVFDWLLLDRIVPQEDFVAWLEDFEDKTPGRTAVMFQVGGSVGVWSLRLRVASWGLWIRGELGPKEQSSESEEDDEDIEALFPKREAVKISTRRLR